MTGLRLDFYRWHASRFPRGNEILQLRGTPGERFRNGLVLVRSSVEVTL